MPGVDFNHLRSQVDCLDVCEYLDVQLKGCEGKYSCRGVCPICQGGEDKPLRNGPFAITADGRAWYCQKCGRSASVHCAIGLWQRVHKHRSLATAARHMADALGLEILEIHKW